MGWTGLITCPHLNTILHGAYCQENTRYPLSSKNFKLALLPTLNELYTSQILSPNRLKEMLYWTNLVCVLSIPVDSFWKCRGEAGPRPGPLSSVQTDLISYTGTPRTGYRFHG